MHVGKVSVRIANNKIIIKTGFAIDIKSKLILIDFRKLKYIKNSDIKSISRVNNSKDKEKANSF